MPIDPIQAAEIARDYGLSLADALTLQDIARTVDEGRAIAERYQPTLQQRIAAAEAAKDWATTSQLKAQWSREIQAATDHNGHQRPTSAPPPAADPTPPTGPSAAPSGPPAAATPIEALKSGAPIGEPSLQEQIAAAEAARDWATAGHLKGQLLLDLHKRMEGNHR